MSTKNYMLSVLGLLLVMASSASALVITDSQTWTAALTQINTLSNGLLEIGPTGNLTITGAVYFDGVGANRTVCKLIMNGGILTNTDAANGVIFTNSYGPAEMWINSGTFTVAKIRHRGRTGSKAPATIFVGGGTLIVQTGYNPGGVGSREYNPAEWIKDMGLFAQDGYKLKLTDLGGGAVKIEADAVPGAAQKSPFDGATESDVWPLWWADGTGGPFTSYDIYLGTSLTAVQNADNTRGPCNGAGAILSDIDGDCSVNSDDLMYLADQWLGLPSLPSADVAGDPNVNLPDFGVISSDWLDSNPFQGNQTAKKFRLNNRLIPGKTYYWRVDARNGSTVIPGQVRNFTAVPRLQPEKFVTLLGWSSPSDATDKAAYLMLLKNMGINTIQAKSSQLAYLLPEYGIQNAIYNAPSAAGDARDYETDWRVWGHFESDEPDTSEFPYWAWFHWTCHWAAPLKPAYTNIQSINYGVSRSYVETFIDTFNPEILSFDYYEWYWSQTLIENLEYFRKQAMEHNIPLYSWVEVDASTTKATNLTRIRRSVYLNLLYGVKGICWFSNGKVFNTNGTILNQNFYDVVQEVNVEINKIGPELLDLTSTAVYHTGIGSVTKDWTGAQDPMVAIPGGHWVQITEDSFGLGMFQNQDGDDYAMVVNRVYSPNGSYRTATVTFKTAVTKVEAFDAVAGTWSDLDISGTTPNQQGSLSLIAGGGKLLRITHEAP